MLPKMHPEEVFRRLQRDEIRLVDVRDVPEFAEISIEGSLLAPLPVVGLQLLQGSGTQAKPVVFTCRSGRRTEAAAAKLCTLAKESYQMDGGIMAWEKAGLPVTRFATLPISINRQVQIAAGTLVVIGVVVGMAWSPLLWLAAFVGAGLVFAGTSGICTLATLLQRMPWNKI